MNGLIRGLSYAAAVSLILALAGCSTVQVEGEYDGVPIRAKSTIFYLDRDIKVHARLTESGDFEITYERTDTEKANVSLETLKQIAPLLMGAGAGAAAGGL